MSITYDLANGGRPTIRKDPDDELDYSFDWTQWLAESGDSIASFSLDAAGGLTVSGAVRDGGVISYWASGGTAGVQASVRCRITTAAQPPRVKEATLYFDIQQA